MTWEYTLKNGQTVLIRHAQPEDAEESLAYVQLVSGESDNLTMGPGEHNQTLEQQIAFIERCSQVNNQVFFVARIDGEIAGMINFGGGSRPRNQHVGEFGLTVQNKYQGLGLGKLLLQSLIDWAYATEGVIRKINLLVRTDNAPAIALYEKLGFRHEATLTRDMIIGGQFVDAYAMGLFIDPEVGA
jgi:RimJ/RimL family protein N-acetyltransferase